MRYMTLRAILALTAILVLNAACHHAVSSGENSAPGIQATASMSGSVVDASTGQGMGGVLVSLVPTDAATGAGMARTTQTLAGGQFQVTSITPGSYVLEVSARGYKVVKAALHFSPSESRSGYRYALDPEVTCPKTVMRRKNP